jgi:hypothetical protein
MDSPLLLKSKNDGFTCTGFDRIHTDRGGQNRQAKEEAAVVIFTYGLPRK